MRINGETFDSIAKKLSVSKQTLINCSKEDIVKETISTARLIKHQKLLQTYGQNRDAKIEHNSTLLKKLKDELAKGDFSGLPPEKLLPIIISSENELRKLVVIHVFGGDDIVKFETTEPFFTFNPED